MTLPCCNCKYKRFGKDPSNSLRTSAGFYVCVRSTVEALVLDDSALRVVEYIGCKDYEENKP